MKRLWWAPFMVSFPVHPLRKINKLHLIIKYQFSSITYQVKHQAKKQNPSYEKWNQTHSSLIFSVNTNPSFDTISLSRSQYQSITNKISIYIFKLRNYANLLQVFTLQQCYVRLLIHKSWSDKYLSWSHYSIS